jgi:transposase
MQLKTILNRVEPYKSFVYSRVSWSSDETELDVEIRPRTNGRPICSGCNSPGPGYDRLPIRRFQFVPLWGITVFFCYAMRRVDCANCGVTVERVPWAEGKEHLTTSYQWFLARWARRLSWQDVADVFHTTWEHVFRSVKQAVSWGLTRRDLCGIKAIGIDEIQWRRGHQYLTLVYQIEMGMKRLLWIGRERTEHTLERFFAFFGNERCSALQYICSDMWQPYLKVIATWADQAVHVLDRFHIMSKLNKAIDDIRASESKQLQRDGYEPVLKRSRWCLLKRPENLSDQQTVKLKELLKYNLKSVRAYLHREDFQRFWNYVSPYWAERFLGEWSTRVMRSRLEPLKKVARSLRDHRELILNWFRAKGAISAAVVEGMNNKVKLVMRKSYGFRTGEAIELALYHNLGRLPEPEFTHEFC